MKIIKNCKNCGNKFKTYNGTFCSPQCKYEFIKKKRIKTNCDFCNKEILICSSYFKDSKKHFCNNKCKRSYYKKEGDNTKIELICCVCNKKYITYKNYHNRVKNAYCSQKCYQLSRHKKMLNGEDYRRIILYHKENKCEICGWNVLNCTDVHHIDFNRSNNSIENLIILCPNHHALITRGLAHIINRNFILNGEVHKDEIKNKNNSF